MKNLRYIFKPTKICNKKFKLDNALQILLRYIIIYLYWDLKSPIVTKWLKQEQNYVCITAHRTHLYFFTDMEVENLSVFLCNTRVIINFFYLTFIFHLSTHFYHYYNYYYHNKQEAQMEKFRVLQVIQFKIYVFIDFRENLSQIDMIYIFHSNSKIILVNCCFLYKCLYVQI